MPLIALLTDFGLADPFVGSMKAAVLGVNARATIVDITHEAPPGDVEYGAFALLQSFRDFPGDTIFAAVVDPGVGGSREGIAVQCGQRYFIGPDNGLLDLAAKKAGGPVIRALENARYFRPAVSPTFHGRDVFGPVAAHLSKGVAFERLGPEKAGMVPCTLPEVRIKKNRIIGVIGQIDRFGNCITTIEGPLLAAFSRDAVAISVKGRKAIPLCTTYEDAPRGKPLGVIGSAGFLEISICCGNAAGVLKLKRGDAVEVSYI